MKIYTKTGDKGQTSLVGGVRISKTHPRLEAYGTIDELNSFIGLLVEELTELRDLEVLDTIQSLLFSVGSYLATYPAMSGEKDRSCLDANDILLLENEIDRMDAILPRLKNFILPGGCKSAALSHICRTIARRSERNIYHINESEEIEDNILIFINRLSDYFFILARKECLLHHKDEKKWQRTCI